ncbi:MAG: B12-binding domain-containing radical SAM protein [Magnetococcales bacterium]|nr:B12-binding domain-containing radical SAM protein [Magnetococcales bacterium]
MAEIVLTTFNARFSHPSLGLRYLMANLGPLRERACLMEFDLEKRPEEALETILKGSPRIIGCAVHVWNHALTRHLATLLKQVRPEVLLVLGGPEVTHLPEDHPLALLADYRILGAGELIFGALCRAILAGNPPATRDLVAPDIDPAAIALPHAEYDATDLAHRYLYVESSRGCPYRCSFCLSANDAQVRRFPLTPFLAGLESLIAQGGRHFKFVDRTFNLGERHAGAILDFFLAHLTTTPDLFVHFEMMPDHLPEGLKRRLAAFPAGALQLEVGVQSFEPTVLAAIDRHQENQRVEENLRWLRNHTQAHLHTDLIVGLPGESPERFAAGFDRLHALDPHEIQVGILKRLPGTPLALHTPADFRFDLEPPYELLENQWFDFLTLRRFKRFSRYWDLVGNSGRFRATLNLAFENRSPFDTFLAFSDWLHATTGQTHQFALPRLTQLLEAGLGAVTGIDPARLSKTLELDQRSMHNTAKKAAAPTPPRQMRHLPSPYPPSTLEKKENPP